MRRYLFAAAVVLLGLSPCVRADDPVIVYPAGVYSITTPATTTITRTGNSVTLSWGSAPVPPLPPGPLPPAPPAPTPTPVVTYDGTLYFSLILPAAPTQDEVALRSALAAAKAEFADPAVNVVFRAYLETEAEPAKLSLLQPGLKVPYIVIQHQPKSAKPTDPASIVDKIESPTSLAQVKAKALQLRGK